jgi:hypothetical protein
MKKSLQFLAIVLLLTAVSHNAVAQCKGFAKKICKLELIPYIHDGNFNAAILTEGEDAEIYKTCYTDMDYRIVICGSDNLPPIEFKVMDASHNVLFSNKEHGMVKSWDFKLDASQQLKIVLKVPASTQKKSEGEIVSGCVAIMFGMKDKGSK